MKDDKPIKRHGPTARSVAAEVLVRVERDAAFAAAALDAELSRAVQLDARDRALATELVYGSLRVQPWLEERLAARARDPKKGIRGLDPRVRAHLVLSTYQLFFLSRVPAFAAVSACVDAVRAISGPKVAAFANAVLRKVAAEAAGAGESAHRDAIVQSAAPWLRDALARALGEAAVAPFLASGLEAPPLGIRVDVGERDAWLARFREAVPGGTFEAGGVSPVAILARGAGKPQALPGWSEGSWSIQEEGSQLIALALGAREGDTVLDACAGRGNKSAVLARAVGARGAVDAADLHASKLARLEQELARAKVAVRATYPVDWSVGAGDVVASYDRVLLDAPCSGTGTLRRRPDLQTRRAPEDLVALASLQRAIALRVADRVRPGGRLVYAVCSVLREEAEEVVAALVAARPDFTRVPFDADVVRPIVREAGEAGAGATALRLLPHVHGTDGYFLASLLRAPR